MRPLSVRRAAVAALFALAGCDRPADLGAVAATADRVEAAAPADRETVLVSGLLDARVFGEAECAELVGWWLRSSGAERDSVALEAVDACSMDCPPAGAFEVTQALAQLDAPDRVPFLVAQCDEHGQTDLVFGDHPDQRARMGIGDYIVARLAFDRVRATLAADPSPSSRDTERRFDALRAPLADALAAAPAPAPGPAPAP